MFKKKSNVSQSESDKKLLLECMERAITDFNYSPVDTTPFKDKEIVEKYNQLLKAAAERNNVLVMRLNNSMTRIGDSGCVKEMIEQVNSQTFAINDMRGASQDLGESIQNIQNAVQHIQESTHEVQEASDRSLVAMENSVEIVEKSADQIVGINEQVAVFREKATKINEIIDMVKQIAKKSGLLALNASIEAARAGEAGRSFAVVANQIKDLSANTTASAEDVVKYVEELMSGIMALETSVNQTTEQLQEGNRSVHDTIDTLKVMSDQLNNVSKDIDYIYEEIHTQTALTENFVSSIESIADSYDTLSDECFTTGGHLYRISRDVDQIRSDLARKGAIITPIDWITVFQVDHFIFTWRLYNNLIGYENLMLTQVNNPTGCKFGKWVTAQTNERITKSRAFAQAVAAHQEIHKHAVDSWHAKDKDNRNEALVCFANAFEAYQKFRTHMEALKEVIRDNVDSRETAIPKVN
ncbi:MAG: CZB domain-containing protein [Lachnospiraceae bacterium]|nr:CZB domain-containing protein [Lachnospiraceae bacterium]